MDLKRGNDLAVEAGFLACLAFLLAINSAPALAGSEQCLHIKSSLERQACEDRKAASLAPKREPELSDNPTMMDSVEIENGR